MNNKNDLVSGGGGVVIFCDRMVTCVNFVTILKTTAMSQSTRNDMTSDQIKWKRCTMMSCLYPLSFCVLLQLNPVPTTASASVLWFCHVSAVLSTTSALPSSPSELTHHYPDMMTPGSAFEPTQGCQTHLRWSAGTDQMLLSAGPGITKHFCVTKHFYVIWWRCHIAIR